ncbi:VOC family protein [Ammoniphilus sp. 3BR4]|uniref:VOC family protein n=1 Tax=Ammoniphilus sp. 3BR4 TaxID=3158265 RepID=UPI00346754D0
MIQYENIHHVSLIVTDLEKAKAFYSQVLALQEIPRPDFNFPGAWYQIGSQQLHLIVHPAAQTLRTKGGIDTKDGHFALRVKDYHRTVEWLKNMAVEMVLKPNSTAGFSQIYCCDPDGNVIEFNVDHLIEGESNGS